MHQQEIQDVPSLRWPETQFWQQLFHRLADALLVPIMKIQKKSNAINGVEHQKTVEIEKNLGYGKNGFQM